ncbi:MAG: TlpA disulfide reductase family protein [Nannocystaceae bacterium]
MIALTFVVVGCNAESDPRTAATPPPVVATEAAAADREAAVTITASLRAHDGGPLRQAEFILTRPGATTAAAKGAIADDGTFQVEVEPGLYRLRVSAVDHAEAMWPLLIERSIELRGSLGTNARPEAGETLSLRSDFVDERGDVIAPGPSSAARLADGRYRLALDERPALAAKLRYQLLSSADGRSFNGPVADAFESDGGGDYWSLVALAGREAIDLDLAALPPAGRPPTTTLTGEAPELSALRAYRERWTPRLAELQAKIQPVDGKLIEPSDAERSAIAALSADALDAVDAAASDDARTLLRLAHLEVFAGWRDDAAVRADAEWILEHVDAADPRLGLFWNIDNELYRALQSADEAFAGRLEAWFTRAQANPNLETQLDALAFLIQRADERGDDARVAALYALAGSPRFADMPLAKHIAARFDPERPLQRGRPFPDFSWPTIAGDGPTTHAERAGRLYLVEFWATWCGPCVAEMPALHAAYKEINDARPGKGADGLRRLRGVARPRVEFVFVSLDRSPADVQAFRADNWSMPWTHAFVGLDGYVETQARFGFTGVPTGVLVDGSGAIVELDGALRGEELLPTLRRALGEDPAAK